MKTYTEAELTIVRIDYNDIIVTSGGGDDKYSNDDPFKTNENETIIVKP